MEFNNTPNRCLQVDGEEIWVSRSVTVLPALFFVQGQDVSVPLGLRGDGMPDECGKWSLPGGYLDYDETAGEAVIRESWEELGLNLIALKEKYRFEGSLDQPYDVLSQPWRRQNVTLRFPLMFFLEPEDSLPVLEPRVSSEEVIEAKWFPLQEALKMPLAFYHHEILRHCLETYYPGFLF